MWCDLVESIMRKIKHVNFLALVFTFFTLSAISSCTSGEERDGQSSTSNQVRLIPQDSIKVDVLNPISVFDYDAQNGHFLLGDVADARSVMLPPGMSPEGNKIGFMIVNREGEILGQFNNTGEEDPNSHGVGSTNNLLLDKDRVGVFTQIGFFVYDFNGDLLVKRKELNSRYLTGQPLYSISAFLKGNLALSHTLWTSGATDNRDNPYPFLTSFRVFDLNELLGSDGGIDKHVLYEHGFPDELADETIKDTAPRITLNKKTGVLNVLYTKFQKLHQYSIDDGSLLNVIELNPTFFSSGNESGFSRGDAGYLDWIRKGGQLINSAYHDMVQIGDYTLLRYSTAISRTEAETLVNSGGPEESEYWETLRRTSYKFYYLIVKDGKVIKQDFEIEALTPQPGEEFFRSTSDLRGQLIGGSDLNSLYVLYNNDYTAERDYKLIVRYDLKLN